MDEVRLSLGNNAADTIGIKLLIRRFETLLNLPIRVHPILLPTN
jgi:hypothetical protein